MKKFNLKYNLLGQDQYFHCISACRASRSGSARAIDSLMRIKEIVDLLKHRIQKLQVMFGKKFYFPSGKIRELMSNINAADSIGGMKANSTGFKCPKDTPCECCCKENDKR